MPFYDYTPEGMLLCTCVKVLVRPWTPGKGKGGEREEGMEGGWLKHGCPLVQILCISFQGF